MAITNRRSTGVKVLLLAAAGAAGGEVDCSRSTCRRQASSQSLSSSSDSVLSD